MDEQASSARAELRQGLAWMVLGVAVLIGSVTMDRLERQDVNPYTVPGLLPGLLGIAIILLGGLLALRSWRRGGAQQAATATDEQAQQREEKRRVLVVLGLCLGYAGVLVGHGLPFWLASWIFVTGSVLVLDRMSREPEARRLSAGRVAKALAIGLGSGVITHLVFQTLFLVRLP